MDAFSITKKTPGPKGLGGIEMRQRKLREDPLAEVVSPYLVRCKRCQREIKLSAKSQYDPHHWTTHRKRCSRPVRTDGTVGNTKRTAAGKPKRTSPQTPSQGLSAARLIATRSQAVSGTPSTGSADVSAAPERISSQTPPLTPDFAAGSASDTESMIIPPSPVESQSSSSFPLSSRFRLSPPPPPLDHATLLYLQRCHADVSLDFACSQKEWSWNRLKLPSFWADSR